MKIARFDATVGRSRSHCGRKGNFIMTHLTPYAALAGALVLSLALPPREANAVRTVALTGDTAPGAGGATFSSFGNPALNDAGDTVFSAFLTGTGVDSSNYPARSYF